MADISLVACPECDAKLKMPADRVGRKVRCPKCKEPFVATPAEAIPVRTLAEMSEPAVVRSTAAASTSQRPAPAGSRVKAGLIVSGVVAGLCVAGYFLLSGGETDGSAETASASNVDTSPAAPQTVPANPLVNPVSADAPDEGIVAQPAERDHPNPGTKESPETAPNDPPVAAVAASNPRYEELRRLAAQARETAVQVEEKAPESDDQRIAIADRLLADASKLDFAKKSDKTRSRGLLRLVSALEALSSPGPNGAAFAAAKSHREAQIRRRLAAELLQLNRVEYAIPLRRFGPTPSMLTDDGRFLMCVEWGNGKAYGVVRDLDRDVELARHGIVLRGDGSWPWLFTSGNGNRTLLAVLDKEAPRAFGGLWNSTIWLWDWEKLAAVPLAVDRVPIATQVDGGLPLDPKGEHCLVHGNGLIGLWNLEEGRAVAQVPHGERRPPGGVRVWGYSFAPDGSSLLVVRSESFPNAERFSSQVFKLPDLSPLSRRLNQHGLPNPRVNNSRDRRIYSDDSKLARVDDLEKKKRIDAFTGDPISDEMLAERFSVIETSNRRFLQEDTTTSENQTMYVRHRPDGPRVIPVAGTAQPLSVDVLTDGSIFLVESDRAVVLDRSLKTKTVFERPAALAPFTCGSVSHSGQHAVICLADGTVAFWNLQDGTQQHDPAWQAGAVQAVAHLGSTNIALTLSHGAPPTCRLWNSAEHRALGEPINVPSLEDVTGAISNGLSSLETRRTATESLTELVRVDTNTNLLAIGNGDASKLYDIGSGEFISGAVAGDLKNQPFQTLLWNGRFDARPQPDGSIRYEAAGDDGISIALRESDDGSLEVLAWRHELTEDVASLRTRIELATRCTGQFAEPATMSGTLNLVPVFGKEWQEKKSEWLQTYPQPLLPTLEAKFFNLNVE